MAVRRVAAFFALVLLLTVPLWGLGALVSYEFLPGLPIAALAVLCPALAAAVLRFREDGWDGLTALLQRAVDVRNAHRWLIPAILINPILFGLAFLVSRLFGANIPDPSLSWVSVLVLFALFLPTAMFEELGWSGYAVDHLQSRMSPMLAAVSLGAFWALWHVPTLLQAGRPMEWIAWWSLWTVSARFIMVWLYNWAGMSVTAVALYHAISNLCWQFYPIDGSYFDPRVSGLITLALALGTCIVWRSGHSKKSG